MTVAEAGAHTGRLVEIVREEGLETDDPKLFERVETGQINPDFSLGANVTAVKLLKANEEVASPGVKLHGAGFIVSPAEAAHLGLGKREGLSAHIRTYVHGRDLVQRPRGLMVIDLDGLDEKHVRTNFPEVYQHLLTTVKPERDTNREEYRRVNWWLFGRRNTIMRAAIKGLSRYIATVETAKHRIFQFVDGSILPDNKLLAIGSDDGFVIGVLSSKVHLDWTFANCGLIGMASFEKGHVYVKSQCFDPFPFPDATPEQRATIAELAEELDATRKAALAEVPGLTMTEIYNLVAWLKSSPLQGRGGSSVAAEGEGAVNARAALADSPLSPALSPQGEREKEDRARAARAGIIHRLHQQIDAAVADAYGWPANLSPSEIVTRLVALNAERAREEAEGNIRWLRPDYQIPRFGRKATPPIDNA